MRRALQILLPFAFVVAAVGAVIGMVTVFSKQAEVQAVTLPRAVEVVVAQPAPHAARIEASGAVEPDQVVDLVAQVQGRVIEVVDGLAPGLPVRKGQLIARIDPRDFRNSVAQAEANVAQAELNLAVEKGRVAQAKREFALLGETPKDGLASRESHLAAAQAAVDSAEASLSNALLALERTRITAPFDGVIASENVDVGQLIGPTSPIVRLLGTDRHRVRVNVPVSRLAWLDLPDAKGQHGSEASIVQQLPDGTALTAVGRLTRLLGELDPTTRTAGLLVTVDGPLTQDGAVPILPGAWVSVTLEGRSMDGLVELPRVALQGADMVYVADAESTLQRRDVQVAFGTREHVYIASGLSEGDRVIVTPLSLPIDGMALDVQQPLAAAN